MPTPVSYLVICRDLMPIMARITDQRQNLHMGADYRDVEKIDQDLTMFADRLPLYFSMYDPETSFDSRKLPTPNKLIA